MYSNGFLPMGKSATMSIPARTTTSVAQSHLPRSFTDHNVKYNHQSYSVSTHSPSPPSPTPPHSIIEEQHFENSAALESPYLRSDLEVPHISSSYSDVYPATSSHFQDSPIPVRIDRHSVPSEEASYVLTRPSSIFEKSSITDKPSTVRDRGGDRLTSIHVQNHNLDQYRHPNHVLLPRPVDDLSTRPVLPGFARYSTRRRTRPLPHRGVWGTVGCTRRPTKHTDSVTQAAMRESAV